MMTDAIKQDWQKIDERDLLIHSKLERIEAVIVTSGGHTCW